MGQVWPEGCFKQQTQNKVVYIRCDYNYIKYEFEWSRRKYANPEWVVELG